MTGLISATFPERLEDPARPWSKRAVTRTVGLLFVVQMVSAMVGTSLIQRFVDGDAGRTPMTVGVLLMMCSGLAVVGIGLLMYPVLKSVNRRLAAWYPVLRITECMVSAACGIYLLARSEVVPHHLLWVYVPTGVGGIVLSYLLYVSALVPRPISVLGLAGYVLLTLGVPLDLLGVLDMGRGAGLLLLAPGGLFELVFLPIWLVTRGLSAPAAPRSSPVRAW